MASELVPYSDIQRMAADVVKGGLFPGIKTVEQAMTLMLVCQSEGLHPMQALTRYHIISGRPAMKADAMLAEFMRRGGTVKWTEWTNEACEAIFTSQGCPEGVTVRWTMEDAARAGLGRNPTWKSYPRQMLKARVASDGVRMADPAVNQGRYTPEEVSEFEPVPKVAQAEVVVHRASAEATEPTEEDLVPVLEASLEKVAAEKEANGKDAMLQAAWDAIGEDERCAECSGELGGYVSKKGTPYIQCKWGHDLFLEYIDKGKTKAMASAMTKEHTYRVVA